MIHDEHNKGVSARRVSAKSVPASSRVPATPKEQARIFEVEIVEH